MSKFSGKQKYWVLGACAGVLVLAGGLCAILLKGNGAQLAESIPNSAVATPSAAASLPEANIVVGTPEVDLVAERQKQEIEAIVIRNSMLQGTIIYGVDVSGMSREQAQAAVQEKLDREPLVVNLLISDGTTVYPASGVDIQAPATPPVEEDDDAVDPDMKAAEIAEEQEEEAQQEAVESTPVGIRLKIDVEGAVDAAFSLMRDKTVPYEVFMSQMNQIAAGQEVGPTPEYDLDSVTQFVEYLAGLLDKPAVNATIGMDNNQIVYLDEIDGQGIDRDALIETILNADPFSGDTITIPMHKLEPTVTKEMLQSKYVKRGQGYTTSFSGSTKNRKYNIRFGAEKINGTILKPGEIFSANETLGKRTRANGWKNAGAYEAGEVVEQPGGGVCQLSSTLYNAVLYADLEIVERRNHSMPVHYVDRGRDATINSVGNIIDFKFKNNTSSDIIIIAYTEGNNLHMEIYGVPFETDEYDEIKIRTKQVSSQSIKTVYEYLDNMPTSYKKTISKGSKGYTVKTFKDYYLGGTLVKTEELQPISKYTMFPKKVEVGTIEESSSDSETEG